MLLNIPAMQAKRKWTELAPPGDFHRVLAPDGSLVGPAPEVRAAELLAWHRAIVRTRALESLMVRMQRRGEFGVAGVTLGEEATGVAAMAALRPGDWCFPSYRQMSGLLYWNVAVARMIAAGLGAPPEHIARHLPLDATTAPGIQIAPYTIFLGASIPHAVGCALSDRLNGRDAVTLAFIGEGATSEGDFYEGLNFAGVLDVPLVVVVQNNQWCISVPAHRQTAARTFADKGAAVGLPACRVDGNDVFAVYEKVSAAVRRAREARGPSLIEAVTYRMSDHNTADASVLYRDDVEVERWRALDPLARFEKYLRSVGLLDDEALERMTLAIDEELREEAGRARSLPPTEPQLLFANHLRGDPGWMFRTEQAELEAETAGLNPFDPPSTGATS